MKYMMVLIVDLWNMLALLNDLIKLGELYKIKIVPHSLVLNGFYCV